MSACTAPTGIPPLVGVVLVAPTVKREAELLVAWLSSKLKLHLFGGIRTKQWGVSSTSGAALLRLGRGDRKIERSCFQLAVAGRSIWGFHLLAVCCHPSLPFISLLLYCDVPLSALHVQVLVYVVKGTRGSEVRRKTTDGGEWRRKWKEQWKEWAEVVLTASELWLGHVGFCTVFQMKPCT